MTVITDTQNSTLGYLDVPECGRHPGFQPIALIQDFENLPAAALGND